jgi:DNA polymerase-3 subunit delta
MIIFVYGKDNFRSYKYVEEMVLKFKKDRDPQGINTVVLDCEKDSKNVMEQVLASPFLSEKRMIVLKNLLSSKNDSLHKEFCDRCDKKSFPETNVILFWESKEKFTTKSAKNLFAKLSKEKYCQRFDELKGIQLGNWINSEIKKREGKIDTEALQYLVQNTSDMWRLNFLIDQLIDYKNNESISLKDVQLFLDEKIDDNIFNLVDAIIGKQQKQAYKMIQEQYRIGEDVQFIFAMVLRQIRILLEMRDLFDRQDRSTSDVLAKKLGLHPFVVKKSLPLIRQYNMAQLKNVYEHLLDLDIKIKKGQGKPEFLLDIFVAKVCYR